jgi:cell division protein ZapA (FtsZ GTPase activity inhibitor)
MNKKYNVELTEEQKQNLEKITSSGTTLLDKSSVHKFC